jgi:hypothetical protein
MWVYSLGLNRRIIQDNHWHDIQTSKEPSINVKKPAIRNQWLLVAARRVKRNRGNVCWSTRYRSKNIENIVKVPNSEVTYN